MKRAAHCFLFLCFVSLSNTLLAQTFTNSVGISIIRGRSAPTFENGSIEQKLWINGLTYFPRLNIFETQQSSMSLGVPITFGFKGNANSNGHSFSFGMDAPLAVDYNFGHMSSPLNKSLIGGYVGAGFGITYVRLSETSSFGTYNMNTSSYGPLARAGVRFGIPISKNETLHFSVGGFYKLGLETENFKVGGGSLLMEF